MTPAHLLGGLLVTAAILIDLVVATRLGEPTAASVTLFLGLCFGQLALLAAWCVRGPGYWLLRVMTTMAATAALAGLWQRSTVAPWNQWFTFLGLYTLAVAAVVIAARPAGPACAERSAAGAPRRLVRGQWTVRGLLSVMTLVAIVLGLGPRLELPLPLIEDALRCVGGLAGVAAAALWAVSSRRDGRWRVAVACLASVLAAVLITPAAPSLGTGFLTMAGLWEAVVIGFGYSVLDGAVRNPAVRCTGRPVPTR